MDAERRTRLAEMIATAPLDEALLVIVQTLKHHLTEIEGIFTYINTDQYSEFDQQMMKIGEHGLYNAIDVIDILLLDHFLVRIQQTRDLEE